MDDEQIIVLNPSVSLADATDTLAGFGLRIVAEFGPPDTPFFERVFESPSGSVVRFVADEFVTINLLTIEAQAAGPRLEEMLLGAIAGFRLEDLERILDERDDAVRKFALRGLAAASRGGFDQGLFDRVVSATKDPDADLRYTAVACMSRLGWPHFRPALDALGSDVDAEVRERAESVRAAIDRVHSS